MDVTLFGVLQFLLLIAALVYVSALVRLWTVNRLLARTHLEPGVRQTIGAVVRYLILIVGFLAIVQTLGINLTSFNVLAGAVGVGVGFGLQNIVSNFISGLIIMFERPVKVGDRIELGGVEGDVMEIGARRTTIVTNDRVAIIVPNQRLITENVVNLRYYDAMVRVRVTVTVAAGADPVDVQRLLLGVARANPDVLAEPPPAVRLAALQGGGNMAFELQVWNTSLVHARDALQSALNFAIHAAFASAGVKLA